MSPQELRAMIEADRVRDTFRLTAEEGTDFSDECPEYDDMDGDE